MTRKQRTQNSADSRQNKAADVTEITQEKLAQAAEHIRNEPIGDLQLDPIKSQPVPVKSKTKIEYAFPTKSRCPRCQTTDTFAYKTNGNVQYRKCQRAICRHSYPVFGTKI